MATRFDVPPSIQQEPQSVGSGESAAVCLAGITVPGAWTTQWVPTPTDDFAPTIFLSFATDHLWYAAVKALGRTRCWNKSERTSESREYDGVLQFTDLM